MIARYLRGSAEFLSRGVVLKRRLSSAFGSGKILVTPDSGLRWWLKRLSADDSVLLANAQELIRPGDVIWDVGANFGPFTFAAAGLAGPTGRVVAIEPDHWLAGLVRRSAQLEAQARAQVDVLAVAVADSMGILEFCIARRGRGSNFIRGEGLSSAGGARETHLVMSITLDWALNHFPPPRVVKIDVEGAELRVLRGSGRLLRDVRPIVLCEVNGHNVEGVTALLEDFGYAIFDADRSVGERTAIHKAVWNTLAVPRDVGDQDPCRSPSDAVSRRLA